MKVHSKQPLIMLIIMVSKEKNGDSDDDDEDYDDDDSHPDANGCRKRVKGLRECIAETILNQFWTMSSSSFSSCSLSPS